MQGEIHEVYQLDDIVDIPKLKEDMGVCELKKNVDGEVVHWLQIVWMRFCKDKPNIMQYKYTYDEKAPFMELNLTVRQFKRPKRQMRYVPIVAESDDYQLPLAFEGKLPLPVSIAKKKDLLTLCEDLTIPAKFHYFYENLRTTSGDDDVCDDCTDNESESESSDVE